jgi:hypothetical protein
VAAFREEKHEVSKRTRDPTVKTMLRTKRPGAGGAPAAGRSKASGYDELRVKADESVGTGHW